MWVIQFNVLRGGERSPEDGSPREFLDRDSPFPLPDIDQTVLHRGEAFVVDDVIWDLERKTVTVELVPPDEVEPKTAGAAPAAADSDDDDSDKNFEDSTDIGEVSDDGGEDYEGPEAEGTEAARSRLRARGDIDPRRGEPEAPEAPPADEQPPRKDAGRGRQRRPAGPGKTRQGDAHPE